MLVSLCTWWMNGTVYDNNLPHSLAPVMTIALSCIKIPKKCMSIDTTLIYESILVLTELDSSSAHPQSAVQLLENTTWLVWTHASSSSCNRCACTSKTNCEDRWCSETPTRPFTANLDFFLPLTTFLWILRICVHYAVAQPYELINNELPGTYNWTIIFISSNLLLRLSQETISWTRWLFLAPASLGCRWEVPICR